MSIYTNMIHHQTRLVLIVAWRTSLCLSNKEVGSFVGYWNFKCGRAHCGFADSVIGYWHGVILLCPGFCGLSVSCHSISKLQSIFVGEVDFPILSPHMDILWLQSVNKFVAKAKTWTWCEMSADITVHNQRKLHHAGRNTPIMQYFKAYRHSI